MECPRCDSESIVKKGKYLRTKRNQKVQRFKCKDCKREFVHRDSGFRMWYPPKMVQEILDLYSTKKVMYKKVRVTRTIKVKKYRSARDVAEAVGVSTAGVKKMLKRHGKLRSTWQTRRLRE